MDYGNYDIESLERLENSSSNLARYNQSLTNDAQSLNYILKTVNANWQNPEGYDLESITQNLKDVLKIVEEDIQPTISGYVTSINDIVAQTKINQNKTLY